MHISDYSQQAIEAALFIRDKGVGDVDFVIQSGIGMGNLIQHMLSNPLIIPMHEIPHVVESHVSGSTNQLVYGQVGQAKLLVFEGRPYMRDGYNALEVAMPAAISKACGARLLILLASCGAVNQRFGIGDVAVINSFINAQKHDALDLLEADDLIDLLVDIRRPYHVRATQYLGMHLLRHGVVLRDGVYFGIQGPRHSTIAELTMMRTLGADVVGAGIIPETVVARLVGLPTICGCLVTYDCFRPQRVTDQIIRNVAESGIPRLADSLTSFIEDEQWQASLADVDAEGLGI